MSRRLFGLGLGLAFGFVLGWAKLTDYDTIRNMLLLEDAYVFLMMGAGVGTAFIGLRLLRRAEARTLTGAGQVGWTASPVQRRHLLGSAVFGVGWALCGACPGPVAVQLGQGRLAAVFSAGGIFCGVALCAWALNREQAEAARVLPAAGLQHEGPPG